MPRTYPMSSKQRDDHLKAIQAQYCGAKRSEKSRMLDYLEQTTGLTRRS